MDNLELELEQERELELEHEAFIYYFLLQAKEASCCENEAALGSAFLSIGGVVQIINPIDLFRMK